MTIQSIDAASQSNETMTMATTTNKEKALVVDPAMPAATVPMPIINGRQWFFEHHVMWPGQTLGLEVSRHEVGCNSDSECR